MFSLLGITQIYFLEEITLKMMYHFIPVLDNIYDPGGPKKPCVGN